LLSIGKHRINNAGRRFIKRQQRLIRFSLPAALLLTLVLTAIIIYRTGFNLKGIIIWFGINTLNYLLNVEYNFLRRKRVLSRLIINANFGEHGFSFEAFRGKLFPTGDYPVCEDASKLFPEYDRVQPRYLVEALNEDFILIPAFFK